MPRNFEYQWKGDEITQAVKMAVARAEVAWGVDVAMKAKARAHRLSGTLSRSLHAAPGNYDKDETKEAQQSELPIVVSGTPSWVSEYVATVAAGSWINYALYEMRRGGAHDFLTAPVTEAEGEFEGKLKQALAEEGVG